MGKKSLYLILAIATIGVLLFFLFYTPDDPAMQSQEDREGDAVAALFGGGVSDSSSDSSLLSSRSRTNSGASLFEDEFWKSGEPISPIATAGDGSNSASGNGEILEPVSEGNPVNPQTGQPYTDSDMERFTVLQEKFPENSVIPRRKTPEELSEEETVRRELFTIQTTIAQGNASREDVNRYYDYQIKLVDDRLELLNYVIETQGDRITPDFLEKYKKVQEMNEKQKQTYNNSRERDLKRAK